MIISMSQPWRHPQTGMLYFRSRVPADLIRALVGRTIAIDVGGVSSTVKIGSVVKVSLRTKEVAEARVRHASVQAQVQQRWAAARKGTSSLSHKEIIGLAGEWYRDLVRGHEDEPGAVEGWEALQDLLRDGLDYLNPDGDGEERPEYDARQAERMLEPHIRLGPWLEARGLDLDPLTRLKLIEEVARALCMAAETLKRRALGDYSPDLAEQTFPKAASAKRSAVGAASLSECFEGWVRECRPSTSTIDEWRKHVESFAAFLKHDEVPRITRSDVVSWKEHLISLGNSPKTINGSKLAAVKTVLRWAVENGRVETNPAANVTVRRTQKAGERMKDFDPHEAASILQAATSESSPAYRWVPLLCAQSGARVSEICQLRAEDVSHEDGIAYMHIRAEAGSLKNAASERKVPLHPHVLDQGFLDFVRRVGSGPLFYNSERRKADAKKHPAKIVAKNVAAWVHKLGLPVGVQHRKAPNHAWRHLFRTSGRSIGAAEDVLDAIMGYSPRTVSRAYGDTTLATKARVIRGMSLPGVWKPPA